MQKFSSGTNFGRQATPTNNKAAEICTDQRLVTAITVGYPQQRKLSAQKFNPQNIVLTKISAFMVASNFGRKSVKW